MNSDFTVELEDETELIAEVIEDETIEINVEEAGPPGEKGDKGDQGDPGEDDKNFTQEFTNTAEVSVIHNLDKKPSVTVINSAGDEVVGEVRYISLNELTVLFSSSFTGIITCN